jgi:hypothetical protein
VKDLFPILGGAVAAILGGALTFVATWFNQRAAHRRQQEADRKARLLDAYSDWAATLDRQFHRVRYLANRANPRGISDDDFKARSAELAALWDGIHEADSGLKRLAYRLRFLEPDAARREKIARITGSVTAIYDSYPEWTVFEQQVHASDWGDLAAPYGQDLTNLLDDLARQPLLR